MSILNQAKGFLLPKLRQIGHFAMKQGLAIAGNLIYGLICVRVLAKSDYAQFAVLFGFMGSLTVLLDIGISGTLAPLAGEQITNLQLIADYVASIRRLTTWLYLIVAPLAACTFFWLVRMQPWSFSVVAQMVVVLLITAWFARVNSTYGAVLILRRDRSYYYWIQIAGSLGSLALLLMAWPLHWLTLPVAILLNVAQVIGMATLSYFRARKLLGIKGEVSPQKEKLIIRLALPSLPNSFFYALQGQITLMLITFFGHTDAVANIGALGRLGQILVYASQMNPILVEPFFARLPATQLKRNYVIVVAMVTAAATFFTVLSFAFPEAFLWVLGPNYRQLRFEVGLIVLGSAIRYLGGFLWVVHSARRFVYWWNTIANIALTLAVQIIFLWKFDLSTVKNVLLLNIASAIAGTLATAACGVYGFIYGPQSMETK